jgi:hypothetical protein
MSHSVIFLYPCSNFGNWSALAMQRITPSSRLNALGVFHRFFNPLSPSKQNMPSMRKPSYDAKDASKIGDDNAASISLV